jgi:hypothetical protein
MTILIFRHVPWAMSFLAACAAGCGSSPPAAPPPSLVHIDAPPPSVGPAESDPPVAPAVGEDLGPILQALVDSPPMDSYFHIDEVPERAPLRIAKTPAVEGEPPLEKFGAPVQYQDRSELASLPHLEIVSVERTEKGARVEFRYQVEGIVGVAEIGPKPEGGWRVLRAEFTEQ